MKVTIDNLINFMKGKQNIIITEEQLDIYIYIYKDTEDLIYWCYTSDDFCLEGIISNNLYELFKQLTKKKNIVLVKYLITIVLIFHLKKYIFMKMLKSSIIMYSEKHDGMDLIKFI